MQKPLYIIGYMGAGKSTLSKVLSRVLNCENHDLDDIISSSVGKTINEIFDSEGEIVFRKIENEQLLQVVLIQQGCNIGNPSYI